MTAHRLLFDPACYSVEAVERALYRMSDRLSSEVCIEKAGISCTIYPASDKSADHSALLADLRNEVLDEQLRARIREETTEVRNLILALAFSNTGLVDPKDA